jgi:hypothetical protein
MNEHLGHENEYRGEAVVTKRGDTLIVMMGAGALGSKLVGLLATQGYTQQTVIDFDRVEAKNYGTQDFGRRDVGRMKASQVVNNLYVRIGVKLTSMEKKVTASNVDRMVRGAGLVVDCFDNHESRQLLQDACKKANVPCLHLGMSGDGFAEIEWNENYRSHPTPNQPQADEENPCEYPLAANLVHLTVGLAAEVINKFVDDGVKQSVQFTLKDFHADLGE